MVSFLFRRTFSYSQFWIKNKVHLTKTKRRRAISKFYASTR